jgi:uncharacterized protein (TIGR03437 family)
VTATLGGAAKTAIINLMAPALVSSMTCSPTSLSQSAIGICTITLAQAASAAGSSITLSSNNASLSVPASVVVAAGATTATFNATAAATIASNQSATVTTTLGGSSKTVVINLVAPIAVSGMTCSPTSLAPAAVSTCTITLSQAAPASGYSVTLASNNTWLTVPASVAIAAGGATATFSATAAATSAGYQSAIVTATLAGSSKTVAINSAVTPTFIQEKDNQITSGQTSSAAFSSPTTAGNLVVVYLIWDNLGVASVSDSLGNTYAAAVAPTRWSNGLYSIQTFYAISRAAGANTVTARFATAVNAFGIVYAHEYAGVLQTSPIDVTAAAAGASGSLNSGSAITTNNTDLLFAGGVSSYSVTGPGAGYTIRSTAQGNITEDRIVSATGSYNATATHNGQAWAMQMVAFKGANSAAAPASLFLQSSSVQANTGAMAASSLRCSPRVITAGGTVTCELLATASTQSEPVALNSSSAQVLIPAAVAARPNQSSLTFQAQSSPLARHERVTITAMAGAVQVEDTILLMASAGPVLRVPEKQIAKAGALLSFTVSAADASDLSVHIDASSIPGGASFDPLTGVFAWMPQARQTGKYQITFTATNSARQSSAAQVELEVGPGIPVLTAPASSCSPGAIARLDGNWLAAPGTQLADRSGASFELGGIKVIVNGEAVPVLYSSANRVDFLCPVLDAGAQLSVEVVSAAGASQPLTMGMQALVPTIISLDDSAQSQGLISFYGTNDLVMERNFRVRAQPAQPGDRITILATGLGSAAESLSGTMLVKLSDVHAAVESVQPLSGYAGVYAIQTRVPAALTFGRAPVALQMTTPNGQIVSNSVTAMFEAVRQ